MKDIIVKGVKYEGIEIELPKTTLLIIKGKKGFIMFIIPLTCLSEM